MRGARGESDVSQIKPPEGQWMRMTTRRVYIATISSAALLALATSASAEGAWVLWSDLLAGPRSLSMRMRQRVHEISVGSLPPFIGDYWIISSARNRSD